MIETLQKRRAVLISYLSEKVAAKDRHGVADAAMDLRDLDEYVRGWQAAVAIVAPHADCNCGRECAAPVRFCCRDEESSNR